MGFFVAVAGLAFLILIHEAGHFVVARSVGMRPRRFYLFFPPAVFKRVRNGIEYGIGSIPLGGYVKIPGMHRPAERDLEAHLDRAIEEAPWLERKAAPVKEALAAERLDEARAALPALRAAVDRAELSEPAKKTAERGLTDLDDGLAPDAYWRAPAWKRVAVIAAGPGTNLVFAVLLLAVVFMLGIPGDPNREVDSVIPGRPAAAAGLQPGDEIVAVDGRATRSFDAVSNRVQASDGEPVTLVVLRDGRRVTVGPIDPVREDGRWIVGFRPGFDEISYGPVGAVGQALDKTGEVTKAIGASLGRIVTGSGRDEVSSPVGIVQGSREALHVGFSYYLGVLALISLSLALLNLLPLLPLDGGHIAFSLVEKVRGRAIPREAYERVSAVGIAVVLMLFVIGLSNDINNLNGG
ncbi:MAG TPA: site-2 protease family protein [Gaiellaceae bacterium]